MMRANVRRTEGAVIARGGAPRFAPRPVGPYAAHPTRHVLPRLGAFLALAVLASSAWAAIGEYRCTDPARVYHGNPRLIRKPAVISADRVYERIPEYKQIVDEGLSDKDVRYHFLMKKASERFAKAVKSMAGALGYDFVAEIGTIKREKQDADAPPDRTDDVIERLG